MSEIRVRSTAKVKAGKADDFRAASVDLIKAIEEGDPDTRSYAVYLDEATSTVAFLEHYGSSEGLLGHFSGWAFSDEVGHYKPAPQIFEAALSGLGAEPGDAAHVGDLRRTDIAGAAAIGMTTVRYRGLHDDRGEDGGGEADFVLGSHRELPPLLDRIAAG